MTAKNNTTDVHNELGEVPMPMRDELAVAAISSSTKKYSNSPTNEPRGQVRDELVSGNTSQDQHDCDKKNDYTVIDSRKVRKQIITDMVYPNYMNDLKSQYRWRNVWGTFASVFFTLSTIVMLASTFLSFVSSYYKEPIYAFIAGCVGIGAVVTDRFAHFCDSRNSSSTKKINTLLRSIGINDTIPDISDSTIVTTKGGDKEDPKKDPIVEIKEDTKQ